MFSPTTEEYYNHGNPDCNPNSCSQWLLIILNILLTIAKWFLWERCGIKIGYCAQNIFSSISDFHSDSILSTHLFSSVPWCTNQHLPVEFSSHVGKKDGTRFCSHTHVTITINIEIMKLFPKSIQSHLSSSKHLWPVFQITSPSPPYCNALVSTKWAIPAYLVFSEHCRKVARLCCWLLIESQYSGEDLKNTSSTRDILWQ